MLTVVPGDGSGHEGGKDGSPSLIDEIVREGARRMLAEALQAEGDAYIAAHAAERDANGRRLVVRNGSHEPREVLTSAGAVEVLVPRDKDKRPALGPFPGSAGGLSAAVITRLSEAWRAEQRAFAVRDLSGADYVYLWADGIHVNIRLEGPKLCLLVMIGVRADGR